MARQRRLDAGKVVSIENVPHKLLVRPIVRQIVVCDQCEEKCDGRYERDFAEPDDHRGPFMRRDGLYHAPFGTFVRPVEILMD